MSETAVRRTQADRRAKTREALLKAAAHGLATYGYANLVLERVANEAGYTRGALYHQFANKEELTLAVVDWIQETWDAEVRQPALAETDPLAALLTTARGHALYCRRREGANVMLTLRVEFTGQEHAIGRILDEVYERLEADCCAYITAARSDGTIPAGPPPQLMAAAFLAVLESLGIAVHGHEPHDVEIVERGVRGILGLAPAE